MNKILSTVAAAALVLGFTSCNNDDPQDVVYQYPFNNCYAVVTSLNGSAEPELIDGVQVIVLANATSSTAVMQIGGLKNGGTQMPIIAFEERPWSMNTDGDWFGIKGAEKAYLATGTQSVVGNMEMSWLDRADLMEYAKAYSPAMEFRFKLNNDLYVAGGSMPIYLGGSTTSTPEGGQGFTSTTSLYKLDMDFTAKTATLSINGAAFAQGMPALDMKFPGIAFTVASDATVSLSCAALTPEIDDVPQPNYPISDLKGSFKPGKGTSSLEFTCTFRGMPFKVVATLNAADVQNFLNNH